MPNNIILSCFLDVFTSQEIGRYLAHHKQSKQRIMEEIFVSPEFCLILL